MKNISTGSYVKILDVPSAWEGSGELEEERCSLVGHVGLVVESCPKEEFALVRFINRGFSQMTADRNIEKSLLYVLATPNTSIELSLFDNA